MRLLCALVLLLSALNGCVGQPDPADAEISALAVRVPGFETIALPAGAGQVEIDAASSITADMLRGVALDDEPPVVGEPAKPYPANMTDDWPAGTAPYVAGGIQPFRFRHFTNEFSYGGWHNWAMHDYASTHGFQVVYPYNHKPDDWTHLPVGTSWLRWGGFVDWRKWLPEHGIEDGRYDLLPAMDVKGELVKANVFKLDPGYDQLMIDMEHGLLSPDALRKQDWYPADAPEQERADFEKRYYDGYALTYIAPVQAAREAGWRNISIYGWQPFGRRWFGIEKAEVDPDTDWAWNAFGKAIYDEVDILNPSVYCFYWSSQNVAYTLANIDLNMRLVNSCDVRKPVRPYYWTLMHGGGGGWRWWRDQPLSSEETRAMTAACFFTGCDGLVLWNWSGTGNHHRPGKLAKDVDLMVGIPFELAPEGSDEPRRFARYEVLHVLDVSEDGTVRFQRVERDKPAENYGIRDDRPLFSMSGEALNPYLRCASEPVAAMVEGLALAKCVEYCLRNGEVKIDIPAQLQFKETLPIVRRVKTGPYHIVLTYDQDWAAQEGPRRIALEDFDGVPGRRVTFPADAQTRLFVLRDAAD